MNGKSRVKAGAKGTSRKAPSKVGSIASQAAARLVQVRHLEAPPRFEKPKSIHTRRLLPFVAEGQDRPFHSLNTRAIIHQRLDTAQDLVITLNTPIPQPGQKHAAGN